LNLLLPLLPSTEVRMHVSLWISFDWARLATTQLHWTRLTTKNIHVSIKFAQQNYIELGRLCCCPIR
jgi:hypothetical protein